MCSTGQSTKLKVDDCISNDGTNRKQVDEFIEENCQQRDCTQVSQDTSLEHVNTIIAENCAYWVPPDLKQRHLDICQHVLLHFENKGGGFHSKILTAQIREHNSQPYTAFVILQN